jgi:carbonic anhydrase/acetyltransferase-like protein (isoleucine patch superfamily)
MALILPVQGVSPVFGENCWLAENATVVGQVTMGSDCSVWFTSVVRGDVNTIEIGNKVNIQDGAIIHGTYKKASTKIGNCVSIGHRAMIHGCTIHDYVLVGMGAIIMDHCMIESNCIIAAGAVVPEGTHVKSGSVWAGVPAKKIKELSTELFEGEIMRIANNYSLYASWFQS